tara:strand:- start:3534 stop:3974 length:441 start_codon:yes stop_codon:yes gene_type:complete
MAKVLTIHEILTLVQEASTKQDRVALIKKHNCLALRDVLKGGLDDSITWILPPGAPPYRKDDDQPVGLSYSTLHKQSPRLRYFIAGGPGERLTPAKREKLFIEVLESIHPTDAELLIAMKSKQLKKLYPCLTKLLVQAVFPNLIVK